MNDTKRRLYLECYAGISGDMFAAAMIDLGVDAAYLTEQLGTLPLGGYRIEIGRTKKAALDACDFNVILDEDNRDHDMQYLYGEAEDEKEHHAHEHKHIHHHESGEGAEDPHEAHGKAHHHEHRHLADVVSIINNSQLSDNAKKTALRIFDIIAEAEAKAHGTDKSAVHFHEVGAVDSIVDIAAAAVCLDKLGIKDVVCSPLSEGRGSVRCQHGLIPVPVPAVVNIASKYNLKLHFTNARGELVTPTGAAIAAAVKTEDTLPDSFRIEKVGIGAGKREYDMPNVLRAMIIE